MKIIEKIRTFEGWLLRCTHFSTSCQCDMVFSVYMPPTAEKNHVPTVYWLSGLTCNDENFRDKSGALRYAAELGLAIVMPDTSPRGDQVADNSAYDLGQGAGFYVNATQTPWSKHYQMYNYVNQELPRIIEDNFPVISGIKSISGHSMGGHGALISGLKNPTAYRSISAFSPICHPSKCTWGQGCFNHYLGQNQTDWCQYDATELVKQLTTPVEIFIDQGTNDEFYEQLLPANLEAACAQSSVKLILRKQADYDHSYHFVSSFIGEHLAYHHEKLTHS
jgi:S-formylglutathione hydrolase